jgi:phage tail sheath gpL-like
MIPFKRIPENLRTPLFYAEIDPSHANTAQVSQRALIIGQIIAGVGIATPNIPTISQGPADARVQGGPGSMLARMVAAYAKNDSFGELWQLPLADPVTTAAVGSINLTAPATAPGTLNLYIAGTRVQMGVTGSQTAVALATALALAINAAVDLPVTAAVNGSVATTVDLTAKNVGALGNDIDIRTNFQGNAGGEALPAGMAITIVPMAGGTTSPSLTTALANLMDMPFDFIVMPYTDTTSLDAMKAFLNDTAGRWSWAVQVYGHVFSAYRGNYAAQVTLGSGRNDQHASILGFYDSPTSGPEWAAAMAGAAAVSLRADPGVPLQTLALEGVLAPPLASRFPLSERNTLLYDGISTYTVATDGTVQLENVITTYRLNTFGQPDNSYLEIETMFLLAFVLRFLAIRITSKFSRVKLAADGTRFGPGSNIVTPAIIKADQIAAYGELEFRGMVQRADLFAKNIIVEQNATNPNRVDVLWAGTLIDQLRIFALLAQFRLN